ncbi:hypothetical protein GN244_ATG18134 [Phytophthora infestans]|uniref:Bzip transcription factor n=1 Tax=Phytophthora infestans TaxID=4787 RepID=A0A833WDX8_PHYIN|nr:hypothetical protein GN244_ATG18134 [Phytophthora infestans]KAI9992265.1 hypothetical protein PInf_017650 [Phytophthora infestans]
MNIRRLNGPYAKPNQSDSFVDTLPSALKLMSNSERGKYYRRKRKLQSAQLKESVSSLREEIAALTISHQVQQELAVSQRRTPLGAAARIVDEYCSLFSRGTPVRLAVNEQDASASLVAQATNAQRGFLSAIMPCNVRFGEFLGVDLLLDQWQRYSLYHAAIEWTMKSLNVVQVCDVGPLVISILANLRVRYSRRTIEKIFPHLLGDEALVQSLIGLEVTYPCANHFHFSHDGKIEWYAPEADFVGALMGVLKDPVLVARVIGHALIKKGHMIGDESDGRQLALAESAHSTEVRNATLTQTEVSLSEEPVRNCSAIQKAKDVHVEDFFESPPPQSPDYCVNNCKTRRKSCKLVTSQMQLSYILGE